MTPDLDWKERMEADKKLFKCSNRKLQADNVATVGYFEDRRETYNSDD